MVELLCGIPGADGATAARHAVEHLALAASIVSSGVVFLGAAVIAYMRPPRPERVASGGRSAP